jgi:PAS domain S-box-containing protein
MAHSPGIYRAVFDASEDALILGDISGRIRHCNPAACAMYGYSMKELRRGRLAWLFPEQLSAVLPDTVSAETVTGGLFVWRSCRRKDGSIFPARVSTQLIEANREQYLLVCIRNLVIRKSPRLGQVESESAIRIRDFPAYTVTWQHAAGDFIMIGCNMATEDFTNVSINDFIGKRASELFADRPDIIEDLNLCFRAKTAFKRKMPYRMFTTGEERTMSATFVYANPHMIVLHLNDITEREQALQDLLTSEHRTKTLFRCMPVPTITWQCLGEDFVLLDYNLPAEKFTSGLIAGYVGVPASRVFNDRPDILDDLKRCFKERNVLKRELNYRMFTTGEKKILALTCAYIPPDLVMFHMEDITGRKTAEAELRKSESSLKILSSQLLNRDEKVRKQIAMELHDSIGQYLTTIKFNAEAGLNRLTGDVDADNVVDFLKAGIPVIQRAIEEVRRISMDLRPSILDDLGILATISWFCREFENVHTDIRVDRDIDIDEEDVPDGLKIIIYRVLQEAFNNAAKHSRASRLLVRLNRQGAAINLAVSDNGTGFEMEEVSLKEGMSKGLGLASMRERVELSGGRFAIETGPGRGTLIKASWPL